MKTCSFCGAVGLLGLVLGLSAMAPSSTEATPDEQAVARATTRFYAALNDLFEGDVEPMKLVWSHENDVTYMGPAGGIQLGWNQVLANWQAQAAKKLGGNIRPDKLHATVGNTLAVVVGTEGGENVIDGKPQHVSIRATTTFRKENGEWKVIGHHTDLLPFLEKQN